MDFFLDDCWRLFLKESKKDCTIAGVHIKRKFRLRSWFQGVCMSVVFRFSKNLKYGISKFWNMESELISWIKILSFYCGILLGIILGLFHVFSWLIQWFCLYVNVHVLCCNSVLWNLKSVCDKFQISYNWLLIAMVKQLVVP